MKKYILSLVLLTTGLISSSQISNPSFENVTGNKPNNWNTGPVYSLYPIRDTNVAYSGTHAAAIYGSVPPALNGAVVQDFANGLSYLPTALTGYFKFYPEMGDSLIIYAELWKQGNYATRAKTNYSFSIQTGTTSSYTPFIIPIDYTGYLFSTYDSAYISIYPTGNVSALGYNWAHANTIALIDELDWAIPLSVNKSNRDIEIKSVFPNPTNSTASILYTLAESSDITLRIYDLNGRLISEEINKAQGHVGQNRININCQLFTSGIYIVELSNEKGSTIKNKLIKY